MFHGVKITDTALIAASSLSARYITDRFLPDKAIDLVDEACALIKTELDSMPTELDELQRRIMQMEIEEAALKKETDAASIQRLETLQKELADERDEFNALKAKWDNEKASVEKLSSLREQIEDLNKQIEKAQQAYDLNKAAQLQYGELPKLKQELAIEEERVKSSDLSLVHESVTEEEISNIVAIVSSVAFLVFGADAAWLRYLAACMLAMTFFVTVCILVPMGGGFENLMLSGVGLYHHTLVPIISIASYALWEPHGGTWILPVAVTLVYGLTMIGLNAAERYDGPYPFFRVHEQGIPKTVLWVAALIAAIAAISWGVACLAR